MKNKNLFWVFALSSAVYFTQGIEGLPAQSLFYYFKETLKFPAEKIMFISSLTAFAWLVKPLIGYLVDSLFSKRAWIFISLALDIVFVLLLGLLQMPFFILLALLLVSSGSAAFRDVATDGIMCVEGKKYQVTGKIQSIQWASLLAAGIFTGLGGAFIAQHWGYQAGFLCLIPVYLLVGLPVCLYREEILERRKSTLFADLRVLFSSKEILIIGLFIFLYKYAPSFGTPLFYIQRDSFKWDKMWIGMLSTLSIVFGIIGALLYYRFSQKINIKKWLYYSVFLGGLTTLSYLYYTPVTAVVYDIVYSLLGMFIFLMIMDFMARHSVKGLEATSFAFLCSLNNLAGVTGNLSGAFLLPLIGLKWLIVLSAFTSFLCLLLINKIE
ncbi:MAG: MFS transporter [Candidatus Omnitrophica bacterium]|nr:MFS transporter [Candidatus Omnitrophota bacterium]